MSELTPGWFIKFVSPYENTQVEQCASYFMSGFPISRSV
jgi:hypothetical protein